MARWTDIEVAVPDLAARARACFDRNKHKTMATLRADGAPRISGTEIEFRLGDVWLGSMPEARKAHDLQHDGRVAIHSGTIDPGDEPASWPGEAKLAGRAHEVRDPAEIARWIGDTDVPGGPGGFHLFRIDVTELVLTGLNQAGDRLVVEWWREGDGRHLVERT